MNRTTLNAGLALVVWTAFQANAAEPVANVLDRMVVTATGQESAVRDVQASVEVLDRERLERYGDGNVAQVLKQAVGVQASNSGASGDIAIRGLNRNHTLVLVDGFRRTNNYGSNNPSQISFFDVERIEIVRGPLSSLYGSEALGGVVNVITRHPGANPGTSVLFTVGAAERGRETVRTGVNVRTGDTTLGHSFTVEQNFRDRLRHRDSASDDYGRLNNWSGSYRGRWSPDAVQSLGWAIEVFDRDNKAKHVDTSGPYTRFEEERRTFGSLDYRREVGPGELVLRGSYGRSKGSTNRSHPEIETTHFRQYQSDAVYQFFPHDDHSVSLGAGMLRDELDVSINSRKATRNNRFVLIQDQWQIDPSWQLVAGVRFDRFDDFGSATNPRVSLGWQDGPWGARFGYGTAFRAPSLLEQYSSFVRGRLLIRGNPELKPEESKTWEAMLRREFGRGYVEVTVHRNRIEQLIESFTTAEMAGPLRVVEYRNISRARVDGVELVAHWPMTEHWSVTGGVDLLDAKDAATRERLTGRAKQTWRLETQYERGPWSLSLRARHMKDYLAVGVDAPRGAPPHDTKLTRVDARLHYAWRNGVEFFGGIDNVFDKRDPDNFSITSTGNQRNDPDARYVHAGVRLEF